MYKCILISELRKRTKQEVNKMILIVRMSDNKILSRYEAWAQDAYETAIGDVRRNGYEYIKEEITFMGDMVIWVK